MSFVRPPHRAPDVEIRRAPPAPVDPHTLTLQLRPQRGAMTGRLVVRPAPCQLDGVRVRVTAPPEQHWTFTQ